MIGCVGGRFSVHVGVVVLRAFGVDLGSSC